MPRRRRRIPLPLAALAAILLLVIVLFDWNWLRSPLEGAVSVALEREFEVAELDVDLGARPVVTLQQVRIANAEWGSRPDMLTIRHVRFALEPWPLLKGEVRLPFLEVEHPDLLLETNREGLANWKFGEQDAPETPPAIPTVRELEVADAVIHYRAPDRPEDLVAALDSVRGALTDADTQLSAAGTLERQPLSIRLASAPLAHLEADTTRFPFEVEARLGATRVAATGSAERLREAQGLSIEIVAESEEPGRLLALVGRETQGLGRVRLQLALTSHDQIWALRDIDARVGESDILGQATVDLGRPEPLVSAKLISQQIRVQDLGALLPGTGARARGAAPEAAIEASIAEAESALAGGDRDKTEAGAGFGLRRDMLPKIDAEVSYTVERLSGPELALSDLELHAGLEKGLPRLELTGGGQYQNTPVAIDVRLGRPGQTASAEGAYPVQARIAAAATQLQIEGVIGEPATLDGLDLRVHASSEDMGDLLALADLELPPIPPFALSGHVVQDGQVWRIGEFYGQFSESEITGELTVDLAKRRPFITAELGSKRLLVSDLITAGERPAVVEVDAAAADAEASAAGRPALMSIEGINFDALPEIDADVSFRGEFVQVQEFRFDRLSFDLKLRDQVAVLDASGEGQFRDGPLTLEARLGNEQSLQDPAARYPIDVRLNSEETAATVAGTAAAPGRLEGLQVDVALRGPNLDRLGEVLQLSLPTTPPFELRSRLTHEADRWNLAGLNGTIGDSDIQGNATVVVGGERPTLEAELTSNRLDFGDLGLVVGVAPADSDKTLSVEQERAAAEQAASPSALPDEPFDVPELRAMDARVSYRARQVLAQKLPLESMALDLTLEDGQLTFAPLRFDLADGNLVSTIRLDGRSDVLVGDLQLEIRNMRMNELLSRFDLEVADLEMEQEGVGTFRAHAQLAVRGNSIKQLAGSADGQVALIMGGGQINAVVVEAIGLDLGELLAVLLTGERQEQDEMVPIQCFVAEFEVQEGVMRAAALVLETSDSTITGKGQIDLGAETLALEFVAHPKDASILTASTPVRIEGTLKDPQIDPISEELQEKSLAALALGAILPVIGAIFPFLEEGETEDTNCARLIQAAVDSVENAASVPQ